METPQHGNGHESDFGSVSFFFQELSESRFYYQACGSNDIPASNYSKNFAKKLFKNVKNGGLRNFLKIRDTPKKNLIGVHQLRSNVHLF